MVSNFDAQFTKQQIDFFKKEENKKNKKTNKWKNNRNSQTPESQLWELAKNHDHDPKKQKREKQVFNTKKKHAKRNMKKNREDSDSKSLLPENKNERGEKINFQKQNSGWKSRLLICEVARSLEKERVGRWRKEGKGRKGKRKKEKSQEQIIGKIGSASQRETNQVSLFLLPTNKRSICMEQQI